MKRMRVVIVTQYYWPEDFAAGVYIPELAERLTAFGHEVTVITGPPSYPTGRIAPGYNRPFKTEERRGVRIVRIWFPPSARSAGAARRGLTALSFAIGALPASVAVRHRPDVVLGFSPPIFMAAAAGVLARRWNVPWLLNVKDLFTESIVASGLLARDSATVAGLLRVERAVYRDAARIVVNAHGFADALRDMGVPADRLAMIPDWADGDFIRPLPRDNSVRADWGLDRQFVILYSGSLGYSSNLETAIDALARLRDLAQVKLVIVGEGVKKAALEARARALAVDSVMFKPLQPRARLPEVLAAADLSLVTLSESGGRVSTQGKLYSLLAAGRPVLAIAPPGNDARRIVDGAGCGWGVDTNDGAGVERLVRGIFARPAELERAGAAARDAFERGYSLDICARQFESQLSNLSFAAGQEIVPAGRAS
jgi:colanic acid biosynthesis glycosyl transferase WcaI